MKNKTCLYFDAYEEQDDYGPTHDQIWEFELKTEDFQIVFSGRISDGVVTSEVMSHTQPLKGDFAKQRKELLFAILETQQDSQFYWARPFRNEPCEVQALTNHIMESTDFADLICKVGHLVESEAKNFYC